MFCCNKCEKPFKTNWQLQRHLSKKNPCEPKKQNSPKNTQNSPKNTQNSPKNTQNSPKNTQNSPQKKQISPQITQCKYCLKTLSYSSLNRHIKTCKEKNDDIRCLEIQLNKKVEPYTKKNCRFCSYISSQATHVSRHNENCKARKAYKLSLENQYNAQQVDRAKQHMTHITNDHSINNNNINTINNNNINITVNPIGRENVAYMTCAVIKDIMRKSRTNEAFIANTLAYIHAHDEHPENHNIIVSNHRSNMALVKRDDKYEYENINTVMQETSNSWLDKVCIEDDFDEVPLSIKQKYESVCENDELDAKAASIFKSKLYAKHKDGVISKPSLDS